MKTRFAPLRSPGRERRAAALAAILALGGCAREDEELQRQLVESRAALTATKQALALAESQRASQPAPPPTAPAAASAEELATAKSRIADLETQLAAAKQQAPVAPAPAKLELDSLKEKLESDLTSKAKTLRELLLKQAGVARIDEIGIRGIEYPPEIIAPFRSAITFALSASDGRQLRLVFPVTADLEGSWSLPGPDKVKQAFNQVKDAPPAEPVAAAPSPGSSVANAAPAPGNPSPPQAAGSGFRQLEPNTFQFDWGDGAKGAPNARTGPAPSTAPPTPSSQPTAAASQQARPTAPATPVPPAQPAVSAPKPVMPVQRDIIIKF